MIEYAVMETRKMNSEDIEEQLNKLLRKGWRVKVSVGEKLILIREIAIKEGK